MRVTRCLSEYLFYLEDRRTGETKKVRGSRVKLFQNSAFDVTQDVKYYVAFQAGDYCDINRFIGIREGTGTKQVLVEYQGFE